MKQLGQALSGPRPEALPRAVVGLDPSGEEAKKLRNALKRVIHHCTVRRDFCDPREFNFKDIDTLYSDAVDGGSCLDVIETLNYLRLYQIVAGELRSGEICDRSWVVGPPPKETVERLVAAVVSASDSSAEGLVSHSFVLGKLWAMLDRGAAWQCFRSALRNTETRNLFASDAGAQSYLHSSVIERMRGAVDGLKSISEPLRFHSSSSSGNEIEGRFMVLMSCEQTYLKVHLPYWLSVAEYLKVEGFSYHFMVVGDEAQTEQLIQSALEMRSALAQFRGYDSTSYGDNVSFSSVRVPRWASTERFSMCARFLYMRQIAERMKSSVIVQDIDMCVAEPPTDWFGELPEDRLGFFASTVNVTIDPWKRFRAGLFRLPYATWALDCAREVETYIRVGFIQDREAWSLDQNALNYMYELVAREPTETRRRVYSMASVRRRCPIQGQQINGVFKRAQE